MVGRSRDASEVKPRYLGTNNTNMHKGCEPY